ncbi:hypothetical protein Y1Q_0015341 [Alligator mississippiensis]|uniref:Uncharacterized protein n=1 Tax=Alligator mississippiensis TaxID=8496 RepID=A0A151N2B2_ALLMI|nr:hypothetical protein Y1Q_0015341 [Alligator mississippiensis]
MPRGQKREPGPVNSHAGAGQSWRSEPRAGAGPELGASGAGAGGGYKAPPFASQGGRGGRSPLLRCRDSANMSNGRSSSQDLNA